MAAFKLRRKKSDAPSAYLEHDSRNKKQIECPDFPNQRRSNSRADNSAKCAAHADETEKPFPLVAVEDIGHERPEDRDDKKIEHAYPNVESAADPHILRSRERAHQQIKENEVCDEKAVGDRDETPA